MAAATWGLGEAWVALGDLTKARGYVERSIAAFGQLDDLYGLGWALYSHGEIFVRLGEYDSARHHFERGMRLLDPVDTSAVVMFLAAFGLLAIAQGDRERGVVLAEAYASARKMSAVDAVAYSLET